MDKVEYKVSDMIDLISKFGVAINVALLVVWSSWARGGSAPAYFWALPFLALGIIEIMILMPPRIKGDSLASATSSLFKRVISDPVFYFGLLLLLFLLVQWLNGPLTLEYDSTESLWKYTKPKVDGLPFCVDQSEAQQVLIWFFAVFVALMAVRHALNRSGKYLMLQIFVYNGALLSFLGLAQFLTCPDKLFWYRQMPVYFFSTFGYPNHAGAFFTLTTALNLGLLTNSLGNVDKIKHSILLTIALVLNIAGVVGSLSRAAIVLTTLLLVFSVVYGAIYFGKALRRGVFVRVAVIACVVLVSVGVLCVTTGESLLKEVKTINCESLSSVYGNDRLELAEAATKIWTDYPWTGVGGWGFRRYVGLYMGEERWGMLQQHGKANVHNDILQFLCEHGAIGGGLIIIIAGSLIIHLFFRLSRMKRIETVGDKKELIIRSISPAVVFSFVGCICTIVHSTIDLPFRSTAILIMWFCILSALPGLVRRR